jgi:thiamine biosynthesis protein ThiI
MTDIILLKQGEMVLKGLNKHRFDQILQNNIRYRLKGFGKFKVYSRQSIVYVEPLNDDSDVDGAFEALKTVFGVITLTRAAACEKDRDAIAKLAIEYLHDAMTQAGELQGGGPPGRQDLPHDQHRAVPVSWAASFQTHTRT